jgi:prephenate dehydratase
MKKIAYLGPEGSFSHIAAQTVFGKEDSNKLISGASITGLLEELEQGDFDLIIIPVENSLAGGVSETVDRLIKAENIYINYEFILPITHCLLAHAGTETQKIKIIYAHSMSFAQCRDYLRKNLPDTVLEPCSSNSMAAKRISEYKNSKTIAAIAPELSAELYKLSILAKGINDEVNNRTRFWILSRNPNGEIDSKKVKTTIIFETKDEAGSLNRILNGFAEKNINLSRIESRPSRRDLGEYLFHVDLDINQEDKNFIETISKLKRHFSFYKCLGSYSDISVNT